MIIHSGMNLFFDTETSGLPENRFPADHPSQPHIVQIAAILTNEAGAEISSINFIVKPDGYEIPEHVSRVHGITTEKAHRCGVPIKLALRSFHHLACLATNCIAHNISFDVQMVDIEAARLGKQIEGKKRFCTMEATRNIVAIPPTSKMVAAGFNTFKSPKLIESYTHIFGKGFDDAHDALADVRACRDIYFWLKKQHPASAPNEQVLA